MMGVISEGGGVCMSLSGKKPLIQPIPWLLHFVTIKYKFSFTMSKHLIGAQGNLYKFMLLEIAYRHGIIKLE